MVIVSGCLLLAIFDHLFYAHVSGLAGCQLKAFAQVLTQGLHLLFNLQAPISLATVIETQT